MSRYVLDSSAVLALVFDERGAERVEAALADCTISSINLAEVVAKLMDEAGPEKLVRMEIENLGLEVADFDTELAFTSGFLRPATRKAGLSLGDRACLATAQRLGAKVLTADRHWKNVNADVEIELVR